MIKTIEDIRALLKVLKAEGVFEFSLGDLSMKIGDSPLELSQSLTPPEAVEFPTQEELDRAVNMPVSGLDDPFLTYNDQNSLE